MKTDDTYVIIDFDGTVADTTSTIMDMLKEKYNKDFEYDETKIEWDFSPYAENGEECNFCLSCYLNEELYNRAKIIDEENLRLFLNKCPYPTILCSCRDLGAYDLCKYYVDKHNLNFDYVALTDTFNKSIIGNSNCIIIDDNKRCLSGDRKLKILFGNYGYQNKNYLDNNIISLPNWKTINQYFIENNLF